MGIGGFLVYMRAEVTFEFFMNSLYIINKTSPVNNIVEPICLVNKSILLSAHIHVCEVGSSSSTHCRSFNLYKIFIIKCEIVQFKDFLEEAS